MEQPLVSIALCTYNGEKFLREQLDSLIHQTYPNLEIIAVDDCSKDQTLSVLKEYQQRFPYIKVYQNESNIGFIKNFEKALSLCSGELIALADQDDVWNVNKIAKQVNAIGQQQLVYHDSEFIDIKGVSLGKKMSDIFNMYSGNEPETFLFFNCVSGHSIMMKKDVVKTVLPLKSGLFHDRWIAYAATNIGHISYIDECLVQYRQHENSDTNILKLSRKEKTRHSLQNSVQRLEQDMKWLQAFKEFSFNKNPELMQQFYTRFTYRINAAVSFGFAWMVFKHRKQVFFTQKKSNISKLNFMFKLIWGLKIKSMDAFNKEGK